MIKVKVENDKLKKFMKSIQESLKVIKVNQAENRKPRRIIPTSRANMWCPRCGKSRHLASECNKGPQRQIHMEEGIYYTIPKEEKDINLNLVFWVQPTYGRRQTTL